MAVNRNIQMKRFNGTDWDSLFPKTKLSNMTDILSAPTIRMSSGYTPSNSLDVATKKYVDESPGGITAVPIFVDGAGGQPYAGLTIYNPTQYKMISIGFAYGTAKCVLTPSYGYFYGGQTFSGTLVISKNYVSGGAVRDFYVFKVYISGSSVYVEDAEAIGSSLNMDGSMVDDVVGYK